MGNLKLAEVMVSNYISSL